VRHPFTLLLLTTLLLAACAAGPAGVGARAGDSYIVTSQHTLFYSYGPSQATGPDSALPRGQRLVMLSYGYGYSQIAIQGTGQTGYVSSDDISPAPPLPKPTPYSTPATAATPAAAAATRSHRPTVMDDAVLPAPGQNQSIPLPEFPASKPPPGSPSFRY